MLSWCIYIGLYQRKVTSSLAAIQRPSQRADNWRWNSNYLREVLSNAVTWSKWKRKIVIMRSEMKATLLTEFKTKLISRHSFKCFLLQASMKSSCYSFFETFILDCSFGRWVASWLSEIGWWKYGVYSHRIVSYRNVSDHTIHSLLQLFYKRRLANPLNQIKEFGRGQTSLSRAQIGLLSGFSNFTASASTALSFHIEVLPACNATRPRHVTSSSCKRHVAWAWAYWLCPRIPDNTGQWPFHICFS